MFFDTAVSYQVNLQDSATYGMEMIVQLHNYVMFINVFIISVVLWFFFEIIAVTGFLQWFYYRVSFTNTHKICLSQLIFKQIRNAMLHMSTLEVVWTLLPVLALITIALPSLSMLYYFSLSFSPVVVINVIGHQWFWSYEYNYTSEQLLYENEISRSILIDRTDELKVFYEKFHSLAARYYSHGYISYDYLMRVNIPYMLEMCNPYVLDDVLDELSPLSDTMKEMCLSPVLTCVLAFGDYLNETKYNDTFFLINNTLGFSISDIIEFSFLMSSLETGCPNTPSISLSFIYNDLNILDFSQRELEKFDSIMVQVEDLNYGSYRLLEVDKPLYLPVDVPIRVIVSSDDVLHSWAVPSLGVKIDCVPGRLNVVEFRIARTGVFYGQCSEICGTQHGFMPICIVAVPRKLYNFI